ncbi:MAG TPA: hypothetical protein VIY48_05015 [Candidatus Paceibacterota bacterium]
MFSIYDCIKGEFISKNETAVSSAILVFNYGRLKEAKHEVVKLQALDEQGKVFAEFKTCNW